MILHTLPFSEPCDGCNGATEVMTAATGRYLVLCPDTAEIADRVYCTQCDCTGTVELGLPYGKYVDWGKDVCPICDEILALKLAELTRHIREQLGCDSVVITRER